MTGIAIPPPELVTRALDWIERHLEWFSPTTWNRSFPPQEVPTQTVIELLLLCRVLARGPRATQSTALLDGARAIAYAQVTEPSYVIDPADPQFPYAVWALSLLGADDPALAPLRNRVQEALDQHGRGLVPFDWPITNQVELAYVCATGGFAADLPGFAELRGESAYAGREPALVSEPEAYAVTHELMYATDLGAHPLPVGHQARARIARLVDVLLADAVEAGQLDLTAELLLCTRLTGHLPPPAADDRAVHHHLWPVGWAAIAQAQLPSGAVPGPPYSTEIAAERPDDEIEAYEFRACYHTTLVTAMAAALAEVHR